MVKNNNNNNKKYIKNQKKTNQLYVLIIYIYNFSKLKFLTSRIIKRSMFMKTNNDVKTRQEPKKKKTFQNHRSWLKISWLNNNVRNLFLIITNYYLEKIFINRCLICPDIAFLRLHLMECECYKVSYSGIVIKR